MPRQIKTNRLVTRRNSREGGGGEGEGGGGAEGAEGALAQINRGQSLAEHNHCFSATTTTITDRAAN